MSDATAIGLFILAGLGLALRWILWDLIESFLDAVERRDPSIFLGGLMIVGMVVLGIVIVNGLRDGSTYN